MYNQCLKVYIFPYTILLRCWEMEDGTPETSAGLQVKPSMEQAGGATVKSPIEKSVKIDYKLERLLKFKQELRERVDELDKWIDAKFRLFYRSKGYDSEDKLPSVVDNPEFWDEWDRELYAILVDFFSNIVKRFFKDMGVNDRSVERLLKKVEGGE
jgi:hypothetical protein